MIRKLALALAVISLPLAGLAQSITGQIVARQYAAWTVPGRTNLVAGTNTNIEFDACMVSGGATASFPAFAASTPVKIVDPNNPSVDEIVTPTVLSVGTSCYVTLVTANAHPTPYYITSGTGGLQEAINAGAATGVMNAIVLDAPWFAAGWGASTIYNAACSPNLAVYVVNIPPGLSYKCNGSHYIPTYAINGFTATPAAGAAAGTSPTIAAAAGASGNIATINLTTGTATTTGTLFTFTSTAAPNSSGNLQCTAQVAQPAAVTPPALTVTATSSTVCTVSVTTAPPASTSYVINITAE